MFTKLEGDSAVWFSGGVFHQGDLYDWQGQLFLKAKGGFVRLKADGGSSHPDVKLISMTYEGQLFADRFNRLCTIQGPEELGRHPVVIVEKNETEWNVFQALPVIQKTPAQLLETQKKRRA